MCCGGDDLKRFIESAEKNDKYTSKIDVIEFVETLASGLKNLFLSVFIGHLFTAEWQTNALTFSTVEELSIFCRWIENGLRVENFMEIFLLNKADTATISSTLVDYLKQKKHTA